MVEFNRLDYINTIEGNTIQAHCSPAQRMRRTSAFAAAKAKTDKACKVSAKLQCSAAIGMRRFAQTSSNTCSYWCYAPVSAVSDDASSAEGAERRGAAAVDVDCVMCLGVAFHELQLMRVERPLGGRARGRTDNNRTSTGGVRRLLLGDVHTDPAQRVSYRPMGFQRALVPHQVGGTQISRVGVAQLHRTRY